MASVTWSVSPERLIATIRGRVDRTRADIEDLVRGVVDDGADQMRRFILEAVTDTGARRVASGRGSEAGRYETGTMYDAVDSRVETNGDVTAGEFGWIEEYLRYFGYQEDGTGTVPSMHALHDAWANASERFQSEIRSIVNLDMV